MSDALRLETTGDGIAVVVFDLPGEKVNKITPRVLAELEAIRGRLAGDPPPAVVFAAGKDAFCVGADIDIIAGLESRQQALEGSRRGQQVLAALSALPCPTVAAVHGKCLGGGLEWALACDRIVAADDAGLGLPEVRLGLLPGWGGTQRLTPRLGFGPAVEVMATGRTLPAGKALTRGLVDRVVPAEGLREAALEKARALVKAYPSGRVPPARRRGALGILAGWLPPVRRLVMGQVRAAVRAKAGRHYPAPLAIVDAVEAALAGSFQAGLRRESELFADLATGSVSRSLVGLFRLNSEAKGWYEAEEAAAADRQVATVAVLGAGVMGAGIAGLAAGRGLQVILRDVADEPLAAGVARIEKGLERQVAKGRLSPDEAGEVRGRVRPTTTAADLAGADVIIEAVVEKLDLKRKVLAEVAGVAPRALLASNTSALSVAAMAEGLPDPAALAGLHFFNPVEKMPLVEVIAPGTAAPATVGALVGLARRLGKVPVVAADSAGFLVNRILGIYLGEAIALVEEGVDFAALDRELRDFGMPVGPCELLDQVGLDVAVHVTGTLAAAFPERVRGSDLLERMVAGGRLGAKSAPGAAGGLGFYRYPSGDGRPHPAAGGRPAPDREGLAALTGKPAPGRAVEEEDRRRLLYPMAAEAARCLEEGVVKRPGEVDLALVTGIGWPPFTGGLLRWADALGLPALVDGLEELAARHGERLAPPAALQERARTGGGFYPSPAAGGRRHGHGSGPLG